MSEESVSGALRRQVAERARQCCEYCRSQARFAMQPFSVEHIEPRSQGGPTTGENLALSCQGCNNHKYTPTAAPDPISGASHPLFHPFSMSAPPAGFCKTVAEVLGCGPRPARLRVHGGAENVEVLVVNERFLTRMQRRYPRIGAKIFLNVAKILNDRRPVRESFASSQTTHGSTAFLSLECVNAMRTASIESGLTASTATNQSCRPQ